MQHFDEQFCGEQAFVTKTSKSRKYWYYEDMDRRALTAARKYTKYVGPYDDPEITKRSKRFADEDLLPRAAHRNHIAGSWPSNTASNCWRRCRGAGALESRHFRLRGVLVGTLAYQAYAGLLGVRTLHHDGGHRLRPGPRGLDACQTQCTPMLQTLQSVDRTFRDAQTSMSEATTAVQRQPFGRRVLDAGGVEDCSGPPVQRLRASQALRYLDFLIRQAVRAVLPPRGSIPCCSGPRAVRSPQAHSEGVLRRDDPNGASRAIKDTNGGGSHRGTCPKFKAS